MKTSRMTVINTEKPAVTVDIGSTIKTVQGVNVTINCQVAGEKFMYVFVHMLVEPCARLGIQRQIRHKFYSQGCSASRKAKA